MKTTIYELIKILNPMEICERTIYTCGHVDDKLWMKELNEYDAPKDFIDEILSGYFNTMYIDEFDYFTTDNDTLTLITYEESQCYTCEFEPDRIYCLDMPRPVGFEEVIKYHGITALSRTDLDRGIKHLDKVLNDPMYETCCATVAIGPIGAIVDAEVITASNEDLYSHIDKYRGQRYFDLEENGDAYNGIIHYADQLTELKEECNNELVTINHEIKTMWVKIWACDKYLEAAVMLAEKYNVDLIIIEEPTPSYVDFFNGGECEDEEDIDDEDWMF